MEDVVKKLGLSSGDLAFFRLKDFNFDYGGDQEIFKNDFHYVPTTTNVWLAGNYYSSDVVVANSAMEVLSWYIFNKNKFRDPSSLALISLGNLPSDEQICWLRREFRGRKLSLLFGNDLLGAMTDIKVALSIIGKKPALHWQKDKIEILVEGSSILLTPAHCSLNRFEKISGIRTGIATLKPKQHTSFLNKLKEHGI